MNYFNWFFVSVSTGQSYCFQMPFLAAYLSAAGARASLYMLMKTLEHLKSNLKFDLSFEESTLKTSLKFT